MEYSDEQQMVRVPPPLPPSLPPWLSLSIPAACIRDADIVMCVCASFGWWG